MRGISAPDAPKVVGGISAPNAGRASLRRLASIIVALAALTCGPAAKAAADPVIAAAGDIACSPSSQYFNGGAGTATKCRQPYTSNLLVTGGLTAVLALGDEQYDTGSLSGFTNSYDPSWGRVKPITFPVAGNHEYKTSGAKGYFDYFNGIGSFSGRAGDRDKGYYSFDVGSWHLIALNTSDHCQLVSCGQGSAQETWLRADLAAHPASCTLAFWHHPRFNSGHDGNAAFMQAIFQDLYDANADVVLSGHAHNYERFAPQDPKGRLDWARGIRQFVVGTGGAFFTSFGSRLANSEVRDNSTYGVLMVTLHPTSYEWRFVPEGGKSFSDSGSDACHGILPPALPQPQVSSHDLRAADCTIVGTPGDDVLEGTPQRDVVCGLGGDDRIFGGAGDDVIRGGEGNDRISGGAGRDHIRGDAGADRIRGGGDRDQLLGGSGRDALFGGKGDDVLHGNIANDVLHGQSGDDRIVGEGGRNRLYGDAGDDLLVAWLNRRGVDKVYGGHGRDKAAVDRGDRLRSVERRIRRRRT
jgi:acid phosphatase type 7